MMDSLSVKMCLHLTVPVRRANAVSQHGMVVFQGTCLPAAAAAASPAVPLRTSLILGPGSATGCDTIGGVAAIVLVLTAGSEPIAATNCRACVHQL